MTSHGKYFIYGTTVKIKLLCHTSPGFIHVTEVISIDVTDRKVHLPNFLTATLPLLCAQNAKTLFVCTYHMYLESHHKGKVFHHEGCFFSISVQMIFI